MKPYIYIFTAFTLLCGSAHAAATSCSRANLTRCLDSVCAINSAMNSAARCQYCGDSAAGTPPESSSKLKNLSAGTSTKYNISDKELKNAPSDDPAARLKWAAEKCLAKVTGCTADDVMETYTPLIEQSCRAAGISSKMADTISESKKTKNASICNAEIQNCMLSANRCTTSFEKCESSTDFDKNFSICSSESPGCGEFLADIRTELTKNRDTIFAKTEGALLGFIKKLQTDRAQKIAAAKAGCENKHDYEECIQEKCKNNMPGKCTGEFEKSEKSSAAQLCTFLLNACDALRIEEDEKDK